MLLLLILVFGFFAGLLIYTSLTQKYKDSQDKKAAQAVNVLEDMYIWAAHKKMALLFGLSPLIAGALLFLLTQKPFFIVIGLILGSFLPMIIIAQMDKYRKKKFQQQLLDGLNSLSQSLKAGLSFLQAMEILIEEMPPPLSEEFAMVVKENKMGVPLEDSFERLNKKMYSDELNMMITAILVARETGGNLTTIFSHLSDSIRQRNKIMSQVQTLTTQARWQGVIMSILPIAFAMIVFKMNPHFFDIMLKSELGRMLLLWCVVSEVIGAVILNGMSKVDV